LSTWLSSFSAAQAVGIEGAGTWGAGVTRFLTAAGIRMVAADRPNRQTRRRRGKSDTIDAEAALERSSLEAPPRSPKTAPARSSRFGCCASPARAP